MLDPRFAAKHDRLIFRPENGVGHWFRSRSDRLSSCGMMKIENPARVATGNAVASGSRVCNPGHKAQRVIVIPGYRPQSMCKICLEKM